VVPPQRPDGDTEEKAQWYDGLPQVKPIYQTHPNNLIIRAPLLLHPVHTAFTLGGLDIPPLMFTVEGKDFDDFLVNMDIALQLFIMVGRTVLPEMTPKQYDDGRYYVVLKEPGAKVMWDMGGRMGTDHYLARVTAEAISFHRKENR